jgi:hypothetical protein
MKRYAFNLGTVLRARQAQENVARASLRKAHLAAAAAELAANTSFAHYQELLSPTSEEFMPHRQRAELAAEAVVEARESLAGAKDAVTAAMTAYLAAARAVSALERLDLRQREQHTLAAQHEEAALVDELVTSRHARLQAQTRHEAPMLAGAGPAGAGPAGAEGQQ